jgi:selenocysteine lyase/cysteine desulfurase
LGICLLNKVVGTAAAIAYCLTIGEEWIWEQVKFLSGYMRNQLSSINGVRVLDRGPEVGGLVTFHVQGAEPKNIINELLKRKINVVASYRAFGVIDFDEKGVEWAVRASPHYYNTIEEIDTFSSSLMEIAKK